LPLGCEDESVSSSEQILGVKEHFLDVLLLQRRRHDVQLARIVKDGNEWKQTDSFSRDDLPLVTKVADQAHSWIFEDATA